MITADGAKMSKSKGNVVAPDEYVDRYGADTVRLYTLFMGPADEDMEWQDTASRASGASCTGSGASSHEQAAGARRRSGHGALARKAHQTIAKVTDDIDRRFSFHTPISAVMELVNEIARHPDDPAARFATETAVSLIQPYAPHVAEELWGARATSGCGSAWPVADERCSARRGRDRRAGERQGARPARRWPPGDGGRAAGAGARLRARAGATWTAGAAQDGRRAATGSSRSSSRRRYDPSPPDPKSPCPPRARRARGKTPATDVGASIPGRAADRGARLGERRSKHDVDLLGVASSSCSGHQPSAGAEAEGAPVRLLRGVEAGPPPSGGGARGQP